MNLNKVVLIGRVVREIELRTTPQGQSVASFPLATNRFWTDKAGQRQEETEYHNIVVWGRQAEICKQYVDKGRLLMVEGRLKTRSWDAPTGEKKYRTEVVADRVQFGPRAAFSQEKMDLPEVPEEKISDQNEIPVIEPGEPVESDLDLDENLPF
ncbi:MAG: single-stranded DNA-binding protein [Patescibacteria group bacterium]